jgi:anaerobic magnesium-protoporphyrin IX monomethyl ester cyclase
MVLEMNMRDNNLNICLITPPSPFLLDERVFLHLGILKVASSLELRGYKVDFLDLSGVENYEDVVRDYCVKHNIKNFGITASTPQMPFAAKIAKIIKSVSSSNKVILGGPHVTLMHAASKREKRAGLELSDRATFEVNNIKKIFDVLVCGDGELSVFEALKIPNGVVDADDRKSSYFLTDNQFTELPLPARHLVEMSSYKYTIEGHNSTSLIAQLGCPFKCTFCSGRNSPFLRKIRQRSTDSIVDEMRFLYENYKFTGFMFYDDELNVNKGLINLLNKISDLQDDIGEEFRLRGFVKAELFNEEQAAAMYRAGFRWLLTGFESGDERVLKNIKKMATREDNTRAVEIAKKHNLKVKALMSIGHAGESFQSIENTKNWLLEVQPEEFDCTIITTYPGSPYFDDAVKYKDHYVYTSKGTGDKLYQKNLNYLTELDYYKGDPNGGYISYVWTDHISSKEIVKERDSLEKEVRKKLDIKFNAARPGIKYEHSMGMGNIKIPDHILRRSDNDQD